MKDGIINIYKPAGMTSHDVIFRLRRILGIKKLGHTGTLDPMATGVLPICIGKATRVAEYMDIDFKKYRCTLILGIVTDTQDITGEIMETCDTSDISEADVLEVFESFRGVIEQKPPMYSAVRINGRRLYEYARAGEEVEVRTRQIYIRELTVDAIDFAHDSNIKKVTFTVECSKGTYIRTICQDAGEKLGCGAAMESLERIGSGAFTLEDAVTMEELREIAEGAGYLPDRKFQEVIPPVLEKYVKPVDYPLFRFGSVTVSEECAKKFIDGWHIPYKECRIEEEPYYLNHEPEFKVRDEYRKAYRVYSQPEGRDDKRFIGVAFHSDKYKKLVADKVFARSDTDDNI